VVPGTEEVGFVDLFVVCRGQTGDVANGFGFWRWGGRFDKRLVDGGRVDVPGEVVCTVAGRVDGAVFANEAVDGGFEGEVVVFCC